MHRALFSGGRKMGLIKIASLLPRGLAVVGVVAHADSDDARKAKAESVLAKEKELKQAAVCTLFDSKLVVFDSVPFVVMRAFCFWLTVVCTQTDAGVAAVEHQEEDAVNGLTQLRFALQHNLQFFHWQDQKAGSVSDAFDRVQQLVRGSAANLFVSELQLLVPCSSLRAAAASADSEEEDTSPAAQSLELLFGSGTADSGAGAAEEKGSASKQRGKSKVCCVKDLVLCELTCHGVQGKAAPAAAASKAKRAGPIEVSLLRSHAAPESSTAPYLHFVGSSGILSLRLPFQLS